MSRFPSSPATKSSIEEADKYYYSSRRKEAIAKYNEALLIETDCVYALVQRGLAFQEEGQLEPAMKDYNRAIELDSEYGPAYYGRGWAKNWLKDYSGELEDAKKGFELDKNNPGMYLRRIGAALVGLNKFDEAVKVFSQAIELNPKDEGTIYNRALCYLRMGQFDSAIKDLDYVLTLDDDWAWAYYHRGVAYEQLGNLSKATEDIKTALHFDPKYAPAIQAQQRLAKNQISNPPKPIKMEGSKTASTTKIIQNDYPTLLSFIFPIVMSGLYLYLVISGNTGTTNLTLSIIFACITLISIAVLIWRIQTIKNICNDGLEVIAMISNVSFFRDRGRVDYIYTHQGQKHISGNAIHKTKQTQALSVGMEVIIMVDRNNPKRAFIRDLYT